MTVRRKGAALPVFVWAAVVLSGHLVAAPLTPPDEADAERTENMCRMATPGTPGKAYDSAVQDCIASDSPNLAYWEKCRQAGLKQHLTGQALSDDVTSCMSREP